MSADSADALARFSEAMTAEILRLPAPAWDTYALLAEVSDDMVTTTAYHYTEAGPPIPAEAPEDGDDLLWDLRDATRGRDGQAWDVVLIKLDRASACLVMNFVAGDAAALWRIHPETVAHLAEAMRPRPEDFQDG
jgi:hypothetical protein